MYCPNCGTQIPDDSRYCPHCGIRISDPSYSSQYDDSGRMNYDSDVHCQQTFHQTMTVPEHGNAVGSLVLGIVGTVLCFFGYSAIISVILGVIGLILSDKAKNAGNTEGIRTAGFVLSLISLIGGAIVFVVCIAIVGSIVKLAGMLTQTF